MEVLVKKSSQTDGPKSVKFLKKEHASHHEEADVFTTQEAKRRVVREELRGQILCGHIRTPAFIWNKIEWS